ncbi:MAG: glycosyltransferase [Lentisphaeria bacterium]|nr:glycosyltransferase [Lentisphaeria bacterium]
MKVLMFGWEFPPHISGGLGTACLGLTKAMINIGEEILFVMPKINGEAVSDDLFHLMGASDVEVTRSRREMLRDVSPETIRFLEVDSTLRPYLNEVTYQTWLKEQVNYNESVVEARYEDQKIGKFEFSGVYGPQLMDEVARYALVAAQLAGQEQFDVIHAHDWMTYVAGVEAKKISGKKLVCHIHATEFDRSGEHPNTEIFEIEKYGLQNADRVLAVSHRTRDIVIRCYDLDPAKVHVVHNAVSKDVTVQRAQVKRNLDEKIVLFLGRVTGQKGPDYFVQAARKVVDQVPNVRFVMAGSGDLWPRMVERIARERLQKHFHFTGFLRGSDVEDMFAMSDVYVMPSVSEPFGITPFEAVLYGTPVIISKQSGIAEIFENAEKVDFWDVDRLTESIVNLLTDEEYANNMAINATRELELINWDGAANKVAAHYKEVTA